MITDLDTNHSAHVLICEHDEAPLLKPLRAPTGCWSAMIKEGQASRFINFRNGSRLCETDFLETETKY